MDYAVGSSRTTRVLIRGRQEGQSQKVEFEVEFHSSDDGRSF